MADSLCARLTISRASRNIAREKLSRRAFSIGMPCDGASSTKSSEISPNTIQLTVKKAVRLAVHLAASGSKCIRFFCRKNGANNRPYD